MPRGLFISFEGGEACGKSTQIPLLADRLRAMGRRVLTVREPGGTPLGEKIRHLLKHDPAGHGMSPETELLLMNASRAELVRRIIRPALDAGEIVLSDRFSDSTTVYQGAGRGMDAALVASVIAAAVGPTRPDLTLWLQVPPTEAHRRLGARNTAHPSQADRFEDEQRAFFERVEEAYGLLARTEPQRFVAVDGGGTVDEVAGRVWQRVVPLFTE